MKKNIFTGTIINKGSFSRKFFFILIFTFFLCSPVLHGQRINKTKYIPPDQKTILKHLSKCRKIADRYPKNDIVCTRQQIFIEVFNNFSCRISEVKEFFLKKELKEFLMENTENFFVEQYFPGGIYKSSHAPKKLHLAKNSLLILKNSRFLPAVPKEDFYLELFLDRKYEIAESMLFVARTKNLKLFHNLTPPLDSRLPPIRNYGNNIYFIGAFPVQKGDKQYERISFHLSALSSWRQLGDILLAKKLKSLKKMPQLPAMKGDFTNTQKIRFLFQKARELACKEKSLILSFWLNKVKIKAYPALARTDGKNLNMNIACNFFKHDLVCIPQQKNIQSTVWLDPASDTPEKITLPEERLPVLLLKKNASTLSFTSVNKK